MKNQRLPFPVEVMNRALDDSSICWLTRKPSRLPQEDVRLTGVIQDAYRRARVTFGVLGLRKVLGIRWRRTLKFKATTHSELGLPVVDDLLRQVFSSVAPNRIRGKRTTVACGHHSTCPTSWR